MGKRSLLCYTGDWHDGVLPPALILASVHLVIPSGDCNTVSNTLSLLALLTEPAGAALRCVNSAPTKTTETLMVPGNV